MSTQLERLTAHGADYRDPVAAIDWDQEDGNLPWLPPEMLSLSAGDLGVPERSKLIQRLSQAEFSRLCAAGIWLEGLLISRLSAKGFLELPAEETRIILQEIREETGHSLMFLTMIERAGLQKTRLLGPTRLLTWVAQRLSSDHAAFWAMVYIGETVTDTYARLCLKRAQDDGQEISLVASDVLSLHHKDEARHIAAARALLASRIEKMGLIERFVFSRTLKFLLRGFLKATLYPTAESLERAGIPRPSEMAAHAARCPRRAELARQCAVPALTLLGRTAELARFGVADIRP